jgi:hypothetical protein
MSFDKFETGRILFTVSQNAFVAGFLCVWTAAAYRLSCFNANFLFRSWILYKIEQRKAFIREH